MSFLGVKSELQHFPTKNEKLVQICTQTYWGSNGSKSLEISRRFAVIAPRYLQLCPRVAQHGRGLANLVL